MSYPEGAQTETKVKSKEEKTKEKASKQISAEGVGNLELGSFKNPKTWKKSITSFFRHQTLRSTKSNDGDHQTNIQEDFENKELSVEQKWQSLGKMFRRTSFGDNWNKSACQKGEGTSQNKKLNVKRVLSSYFGKTQKNLSISQPLPDEN